MKCYNLLHAIKLGGFFVLTAVLLCPQILHAADDVKIKILAINPSPTDPLNTVISHELPPEITPEDIVDSQGMDVEFHKEQKVYALTQKVQLKPREARTIIVRVKNVWKVSDDQIGAVRSELEKSVETLKGTKYEESAQMLYNKISEQLGVIEAEKEKEMGIRQQIEMYRAHVKELEEIRLRMNSFNTLRKLSGEDKPEERTVKFVIIAQNPADVPQTMRVRAFLPKDITGNNVVDKLDFSLLYDDEKARFLVEKEDEFQPHEKKTYEIVLEDIWYIPEEELDHFKEQTDKLMEHFAGSSYEAYAKQGADFIYTTLESIERLQKEVQSSESIEDRIRAFILDQEREELVKKKIKELQDLLLEVPLKRELSEFEKIRQAVRELSKVIDILRLGFTPDLSTTWWIILGIIAFLFVMSAIFYVTWLVKLQESVWGKKKIAAKKKSKQQAAAVPQPAASAPAEGEPEQEKAA